MPDLKNNNPIEADGTYHFQVNQTGRYRVAVGAKIKGAVDSAGDVGGGTFSGASVIVQQDGIKYTDLDPATSPTAKELVLTEGNLKVVVYGSTGTPSIGVKIEPINSPA